MAFYALSLMKLIEDAKTKAPAAKEVFYADDGAAGGKLDAVSHFWRYLQEDGPKYGYFVNPSKSYLIVKPGVRKEAEELFPNVNITTEGHRYLGSFIGTEEGTKKFVQDQVKLWLRDLEGLCNIAQHEPHLSYCAYIYGTSKRWNYIMRTTPQISEHLEDIESYISKKLIPSFTGHHVGIDHRAIFTLPVRHGGLAIENPMEIADREYQNSLRMTEVLWRAIFNQEQNIRIADTEDQKLIDEVRKQKEEKFIQVKFEAINHLSPKDARFVALACEKGASLWLSSLPLEEYGFSLNKQEFKDAVAMRYNFPIEGRSKTCICGEENTQDHSLICKRGGFTSIRHNTIRDTTASLLEKICYGVEVEPALLPVGNSKLPPGSNVKDGARSDIVARGFWTPLDKAYFDIRVLHPGAKSNENKSFDKMYNQHEEEKKRLYNSRIQDIEHGTFTPLVFSTSGGMSKECNKFMKKLSEGLSFKTQQAYSDTISYVRRRLRFELLKTTLISIRGHRGRFYQRPIDLDEMDLNLIADYRDKD